MQNRMASYICYILVLDKKSVLIYVFLCNQCLQKFWNKVYTYISFQHANVLSSYGKMHVQPHSEKYKIQKKTIIQL